MQKLQQANLRLENELQEAQQAKNSLSIKLADAESLNDTLRQDFSTVEARLAAAYFFF